MYFCEKDNNFRLRSSLTRLRVNCLNNILFLLGTRWSPQLRNIHQGFVSQLKLSWIKAEAFSSQHRFIRHRPRGILKPAVGGADGITSAGLDLATALMFVKLIDPGPSDRTRSNPDFFSYPGLISFIKQILNPGENNTRISPVGAILRVVLLGLQPEAATRLISKRYKRTERKSVTSILNLKTVKKNKLEDKEQSLRQNASFSNREVYFSSRITQAAPERPLHAKKPAKTWKRSTTITCRRIKVER